MDGVSIFHGVTPTSKVDVLVAVVEEALVHTHLVCLWEPHFGLQIFMVVDIDPA